MSSAETPVHAPREHSEGTRLSLLRWLKRPGERVHQDEALLELETDKVAVEVVAPRSGVLKAALKAENDEVSPGELLGVIAAEGELAAESLAPPAESAQGAPTPTPDHEEAGQKCAPDRISPAVRRLLREHSLDAASVVGSGPQGRIRVDDVLRAARGVRAPANPASSEVSTCDQRVPHSPARRRTAERVADSLRSIPHVTAVIEADFTAVLRHRAAQATRFEALGAPLTLTTYVLAACVPAIRAVPEVNARWSEHALELIERIDIGVATAFDQGLIVPVIRDVANLALADLARALHDQVSRARSGRLAPADVRGGSFSVSNYGPSGGLLAAPIVIIPPQVAILGVGKLEKRAVVLEEDGVERIVARPRCFITLTIDHRALDGARANRFLEVLVGELAAWPEQDAAPG